MSEEARRARIIVGSALGTVALLVLVILLTTGGGDSSRPTAAERTPSETKARTKPKKKAPAKKKATTAPAADLGPNPLRGAAAEQAAVPVLVWRVVADPPPGSPRPQLYTPPAAFAAQLAALADQGYRPITLTQLFAAWDTGAAIPRQPVVLTFDEGYPSQGRVVGPALKSRGWPGVLNLVPANAGGDGLPTSRLQEMLAAGWEVGAKGSEESDLTVLDPEAQKAELQRIATEVQGLTKKLPPVFAYPEGRFDAGLQDAVEAAGYKGGLTEESGLAKPEERFALRRIDAQSAGDDPGALLSQIQSYAGSTAAPPA